MKKLFAAILTLILLLSLTACGPFVSIMPGTELEREDAPTAENSGDVAAGETFEEQPLLSFLGQAEFGERYYEDTPVALSYQPAMGDGGLGCRSYVFDRAQIIAACDALRGMTVTGRATEESASRAEYVLTGNDGKEISFSFGTLADETTRVIRTATGEFTVTGGEALWDLEFPAYSTSYDVFDLFFDPAMRAFADDFQKNTPVSVGYRLNSGASVTSTDPAAVEGVFRALANASVIVVENQPDQNVDLNQVRDYIFTMEDGTTYTFHFAQRCLGVTANADFGPVYYWLTGMDDLWGVEIIPENNIGKFEGGALSGLREDIQRAAEVVGKGTEGDLTVLGVFIEYSIGEESGYLALEGDKAADFTRLLCVINVTDETVENPEGDKITASVTLSDGSGPIFYFTGDTIQQVVGVNYLCDSGEMKSLRDTVLELASNGENTAEIEEGGTD